MEAILFLAVVAFLVYAMAINPRHISTIIGTRLSAGDQIYGPVNSKEVIEFLQSASWIRDKKRSEWEKLIQARIAN